MSNKIYPIGIQNFEKLRKQYDGYHFTHNSVGIYNLFSLLHAFKNVEFDNYWFETAVGIRSKT